MRDYVVRFLEALYESECDENGVKWKDEYSWRIDNIIDRLTFMEEWWDNYCEFPSGSDVFKLLVNLEWVYIGKFQSDHEWEILPKYPAKCFDIAWELHRFILEELTASLKYKMGD